MYSLITSIGCITMPKDFAVAGTAQDKLYGVAEGLWEPDLVRLSQQYLK
jgi:20S proteasome subunit beta 3